MTIELVEKKGGAALPYLEPLAHLRITVFREFPYLYDGNFEYEQNYLGRYFACPDSFVVLAYDGQTIVGAATAMPLKNEEDAFQKPFRAMGLTPEKFFYFGESVLLPQYRGQGIGHRFFDAREQAALRTEGVTHATFCSVDRSGHRLTPVSYRSLEPFWSKRGYEKIAGLTTSYSWKDIDSEEETSKPMQFWQRKLI